MVQGSARSWCHLAATQSWLLSPQPVLVLLSDIAGRASGCSCSLFELFPSGWAPCSLIYFRFSDFYFFRFLFFLDFYFLVYGGVWAGELQPGAPRNGDVCDCPFLSLRSDILLSCHTVTMTFAAAKLRFWSHLVYLEDGSEHFGPFWDLWGCSGALQRLLCSPGTVLEFWHGPVPPLLQLLPSPAGSPGGGGGGGQWIFVQALG